MPLVLIGVIAAVDVLTPPDLRLTPLLVVAPAVTASFAGARVTAGMSLLAVATEVATDLAEHPPQLNQVTATGALIAVSVCVVAFAHLRVQYGRRCRRAQNLALVAQNAVLRPLPERTGPIEIASLYMAAEADAVIGGDFYAAVETGSGTRLLIGDVRGKGLGAVSEAAIVMGAFRATAHLTPTLDDLMSGLDDALTSVNQSTGTDTGQAGEDFATALLLDVSHRAGWIESASCGHPAPFLIRDGRAHQVSLPEAAPPLGLGIASPYVRSGTFSLQPGDIVLLCTDGLLEARDRTGRFYPLADRIRAWPGGGPQALLEYLRTDLLRYTEREALNDDAALVAFRLIPRPAVRER
ncbi:PP2C family protein-serine/threonine phosphatase [Streptomyces sp. NPDC047981]|uniref:PP2C family protein-serine/threonine phosphatase n=1 Tax=Streptomyces sp. NPDC047981 TaxID=3154610 RepID=UPI00341D7FDE